MGSLSDYLNGEDYSADFCVLCSFFPGSQRDSWAQSYSGGTEQGPEPGGVGVGMGEGDAVGELALPWGCSELWELLGTSGDT